MNDLVESWSEEDKAWLAAKVDPKLQTVAARHGRKLFVFVMQSGAFNFALSTLLVNVRHPEGQQMLATMSKIANEMSNMALSTIEKTKEEFLECRGDIERCMALADAGNKGKGERVSAGGILLDS